MRRRRRRGPRPPEFARRAIPAHNGVTSGPASHQTSRSVLCANSASSCACSCCQPQPQRNIVFPCRQSADPSRQSGCARRRGNSRARRRGSGRSCRRGRRSSCRRGSRATWCGPILHDRRRSRFLGPQVIYVMQPYPVEMQPQVVIVERPVTRIVEVEVPARQEPIEPSPPPREPEPPFVPTGDRTLYVIPGCYVGNVPPKDVKLPASCDLSKLTTFTP